MSDLTELFARDPLNYSKQDLATIVQYYRNMRATFEAPPPKPAKAAKAAVAPKVTLKFDLGKL